MKVLDLFSGTKSIANAFSARGHQVFTVDNNPTTEPDWCADILEVTAEEIIKRFGRPDVIWASPPCTAFSVASISHYWTGGKNAYIPKTEYAWLSQKMVIHTLDLIFTLWPKYYFVENPRGVLRKMPYMAKLPRYTVTYCQYGDNRMKPTDLWTNHPEPQFKPICRNGDSCHEAAPRGSRTGTQGLKSARERGKIPSLLCEHIVNICEVNVNDQAKTNPLPKVRNHHGRTKRKGNG